MRSPVPLAQCSRCKVAYPVNYLDDIQTSTGPIPSVCGICALAISNEFMGINRTEFGGATAEAMRLRAVEWRQAIAQDTQGKNLQPITHTDAMALYLANGRRPFSFLAAPYNVPKTIVTMNGHLTASPPEAARQHYEWVARYSHSVPGYAPPAATRARRHRNTTRGPRS